MELVVFLENARVGLSLAGVENFVTSASCFLAVPMELVANHGSATVSLNGEDYFVIKISTNAERNPVKMEVYVTTTRKEVHTDVNAKKDLLELTVKQQ